MPRNLRFYPVALCLAAAPLVGVAPVDADVDETRTQHGQPAHAPAAKGPWTKLSGPLSIIHRASALRVGKRLLVVWNQDDGANDISVKTRFLTAGGAIDSPSKNVVRHWLTMPSDPKLIRLGNEIAAVFGGVRTGDPGDPYAGQAAMATSRNGLSWSLEGGLLSDTTAVGNASNIDAINAAGQPMFAMGGFGQHVIMHRGLGAASPPDFNSSDRQGAPVEVALAENRKNHQIWTAWFSLGATDPDQAGIFTQKVWPRPNGKLLKAPGSADATGHAINPEQPVALSERAGGGLWMAYRRGYPTSNVIRLWKVGTKTTWDVKVRGHTVDEIALAPSTGGRLWLSWRTVDDGVLHAARTNPAVTRIGAVSKVRPPGGLSGFIWNISLEGSRGPLDVVALAQTATGQPSIYATHVSP